SMQELRNNLAVGQSLWDACWGVLTQSGALSGSGIDPNEIAALRAISNGFKTVQLSGAGRDALQTMMTGINSGGLSDTDFGGVAAIINALVEGNSDNDDIIAAFNQWFGDDTKLVPAKTPVTCDPGPPLTNCVTDMGKMEVPPAVVDTSTCRTDAEGKAHCTTIKDTTVKTSANVSTDARRRRQTESFSGGRSRTPSGFRRQPIKRSAGHHNFPGQGRALQRK
ncbi:unnamed protein product, partial [Allacma fusca]